MTAPTHPASFFDLASGESWTTGDAARTHRGWLLDRLADTARYDPIWILEDNPAATPIRLNLIEHIEGQRAELRIGNGKAIGTLLIEVDASGWLAVRVDIGKKTVFEAYVDRPYEEIAFWPPGANDTFGEPPGRMGKRFNWVCLSVDAWPELAPLTPLAYLNLVVNED